MPSNVERFKNDLEKLINKGDLLINAMGYAIDPERIKSQLKEALKDQEKEDKIIASLPSFDLEYDTWYSEALVFIKQVIPDRSENFKSLYEKPKGRKEINNLNYTIQDYIQGISLTRGGQKIADPAAAYMQFRQQTTILKSAKSRFESSLFDIKQLVRADLFDGEIDTARELLKNRFLRAAGAVAGVVLEKHLKQVCEDHLIKIAKKNPGINDFNELLKSNNVIDIPQWRFIGLLGDYRNLCDHNKEVEPTHEQVKDLVDGTEKVLKTVQ